MTTGHEHPTADIANHKRPFGTLPLFLPFPNIKHWIMRIPIINGQYSRDTNASNLAGVPNAVLFSFL